MAFTKFVGKHQDRRVCVLFRQVPGEDHMCLIIYPDTTHAHWQDAIQKVLESDMAQQGEEFADALHRSYLPDGRPILETLHQERMIKKVRCSDIIMTPNQASSIRLDELNKMLNEMKQGEDAIKRLAEIDANNGLANSKRKPEPKDLGVSPASRTQPVENINVGAALSDADLARSRLSQAETMKASAAQLIAEAERLTKEAADLDPTTHVKPRVAKTKKAKAQAA